MKRKDFTPTELIFSAADQKLHDKNKKIAFTTPINLIT
jgi:hypothetical protein